MIDHEQVYCDLSLDNLKLDGFELIKLSIDSWINRGFSLKLLLDSKQDLSLFAQSQNQIFNLKLSSQDFGPYCFNGILTKVHLLDQCTPGIYRYTLQIESKLSLYEDHYFSYLFNGISVLDIAKQLLQGLNFNLAPNASQNFGFKLLGDRSYTPLYRVLMQDESLLAFFNRILSYHGLSYYFDHCQALNPLMISDAINHFAAELPPLEPSSSAASLSLNPHVKNFFASDRAESQSVLSTGAPRLEPQILLNDDEIVTDPRYSAALHHLNTSEQTDTGAKLRAEIASLAFQGNFKRAKILASGLLLSGTKFQIQNLDDTWLIYASHSEIVFDPHHAYRITAIHTEAWLQDATIRYQALPDFGTHADLLDGIELGTPSIEQGSNLISTNEQGHYHATLPPDMDSNDEARGVHVFDIRTLQPMHSDDHASHMTAPSASEGIMFWSEGFSAEPLLMGTVNTDDNSHPSTDETAQNAYWQDYDTNKLALINSGQYEPYQKTGRKSANIMETPSYNSAQNASYVRLGDVGTYDDDYQSQSTEPGFFSSSTGHYNEAHQGGIATLAGNLAQNMQSQGFTPLMRQMFQLQPSLGTYHILDSVTAHLQNDALTSDEASEIHEQNETTINRTFVGAQNLESYSSDTADNIYVNQQHQIQGDMTELNYNQHTLSSQSTTTNILESGNQTADNHDTYSLNLNHSNNQFNSTAQQTYINSQTTQVTQLNQNFGKHIKQVSTANISHQNSAINASAASIGGSQFLQSGELSINSGSANYDIPSILDVNQQGIQPIIDEQTSKKQEIIFLLDCPESPPELQLCVNNINPQTIPPNRPFTYTLSDDQKKGPIHINMLLPEYNATNTTILHKQIRNIGVQSNSTVQTDNAYFNIHGQLPIYIGYRDFELTPSATSLTTTNEKDIPTNHSIIFLQVNDTLGMPDELKTTDLQHYSLDQLSSKAFDWLKQEIEQQKTETLVDYFNRINFPLSQDNRIIIKEMIKSTMLGIAKVGETWLIHFEASPLFMTYLFGAKAGTDQAIGYCRFIATKAQENKLQEYTFDEALQAYKLVSTLDFILELAFIGGIDWVKYKLSDDGKSFNDFLARLLVDLFNDALGLVFFIFINSRLGTIKFFKRKLIRIFTAWVPVAFFSGWIVHNIEDLEDILGLTEKVKDSPMLQNAADFLQQVYINPMKVNYFHEFERQMQILLSSTNGQNLLKATELAT